MIFLNFNKVKTNEQKLKESEEKFRTISEQSLMGIAILQDDRYKYVNQAAADMLGYTVEELLDTPQGGFMNYIHPEDREFVREQATKKQMGMKDVITKYPYRGLTKSGETIWVQNYSCTITFEGKYADLITMIDFTERKKAQKSLKESEEKYRYYFNHAQVGLFWSRISDGKFIECNDTFAKLVGYDTREECLADYIALEHYVDFNLREEMLEEIRINNEIKDFEIQVTKRDGTPFWASISARTDLKENRLEGAAIDITARKKAEQKLKESEEKYRSILKRIKESYFEVDLRGNYTFFNNSLVEVLGYSKDELLGLNFGRLMDKENKRKVFKVFNEVYNSSKEKENFQFEVMKKNGEIIAAETSIYLKYDQDGNKIGFGGIVRDITDRKKAEKALKESEARFKGIFESKMIGTFFWDANGDITNANDVYLEMVGYSKDEVLSGTVRWKDLTPPEYTDLDNKALEEITTKGVMTPIEKEYIRKNGSRFPILIGGSALPGSTLGGVSFALDITERKKGEQIIKNLLEKLRRINIELEQFAYVASHDLKEPLRMILSFARLLARHYKGKVDEDADDFIDFIVAGAMRMQKLINALLSYSQIGRSDKQFRLIDVDIVLKEVIANLRHLIEESNTIITIDPLPKLVANEVEFIQLFQNLISNAIKFHGESPPLIHVSVKLQKKQWIFSVRDNGIGIDSKDYKRIFIIFQRLRTKYEYEGTGIGLSICKKILEHHKGKIWVESEVGKGSTFYFSIPKEIDIKS